MQKDILLQLLKTNQSNFNSTIKAITPQNINFRLGESRTVGFLFWHIGASTNSLTNFFGDAANANNTLLADESKHTDIEGNKLLADQAFKRLENVIQNLSDAAWLEEIETPYFGKLPRIRLLSIILFHISHHIGQVSLAVSKGH